MTNTSLDQLIAEGHAAEVYAMSETWLKEQKRPATGTPVIQCYAIQIVP